MEVLLQVFFCGIGELREFNLKKVAKKNHVD